MIKLHNKLNYYVNLGEFMTTLIKEYSELTTDELYENPQAQMFNICC